MNSPQLITYSLSENTALPEGYENGDSGNMGSSIMAVVIILIIAAVCVVSFGLVAVALNALRNPRSVQNSHSSQNSDLRPGTIQSAEPKKPETAFAPELTPQSIPQTGSDKQEPEVIPDRKIHPEQIIDRRVEIDLEQPVNERAKGRTREDVIVINENSEPEHEPVATLPVSAEPNPHLLFIDRYLQDTLDGKILSEVMIDRCITRHFESSFSEGFNSILEEKHHSLRWQLTSNAINPRAERQLDALKLLQKRYAHWQEESSAQAAIEANALKLSNAAGQERIFIFAQIFDRNKFNPLQPSGIREFINTSSKLLGKDLATPELSIFISGINSGLESYYELAGSPSGSSQRSDNSLYDQMGFSIENSSKSETSELDYITAWIWELNRLMSFDARNNEPWNTWKEHVHNPLPRELFSTLAYGKSVSDLVQKQQVNLSNWVGLVTLLNLVQERLVWWYDNQAYHRQAGLILAEITFSDFSIKIWRQLGEGLGKAEYFSEAERHSLVQACFQLELQTLLGFVRRNSWFKDDALRPVWGESFQTTINYLEGTLQKIQNTHTKVRALTVLGYLHYWCKKHDGALVYHQEAQELGTDDGFRLVADLNGMSRIFFNRNQYEEASHLAKQALDLARQIEDSQGEMNATYILQKPELRR
jgi:tetratricopeptide (TPR) repeat protein